MKKIALMSGITDQDYAEADLLIAYFCFAKKILKWKPKYTFKNLVLEMAQSDLQKFK